MDGFFESLCIGLLVIHHSAHIARSRYPVSPSFSIERQVIEKLAIQRKSGQFGTVIAPLGLDPRGALNWAGHNGKYDLNAAHVRGTEEISTLQGTPLD